MFTSRKKKKQLEARIRELKERQSHIQHERDQYKMERNELRERNKSLEKEIDQLKARTSNSMIKNLLPVCVLGMHRSGTSCLTGCLQEIGVFLGEVVESSNHNKKGNRENRPIRQLNNYLLEKNGGDWKHPPDELQWDDDLRAQRTRVLEPFLEINAGHWGFKDPRTTFTLPFWQEAIPRMMFIGTFRHPLAVASSLHTRTPEISIEEGLDIWHRYNRRMLEIYQDTPFPILSFDLDADKYQASFFKAAEQISLPLPDNMQSLSFFDNNLRHQQSQPDSQALPGEIQELYEKLRTLAVSPE